MPLPPQTPGMPPCEGLRFGNPAWVTWGNVNLGFTGSVGCYSKLGCHFSSKFSYLYHPGIINHGFFTVSSSVLEQTDPKTAIPN